MPSNFQQRVLGDLGLPLDEIRGRLEPRERKLSEIYAESTGPLRLDTALRTAGILNAATAGNFLLKVRGALTLGTTLFQERGNEPFDTDFLHDSDPAVQSIVRDMIRGMLLPGSGMAPGSSVENFQKGMELNRAGNLVSFELVPHASELDPVIVEVLIQNLMLQAEQSVARDAGEFLAKNIMVVGHKVSLSSLRRVFARAIRTLCRIAPKYSAGLDADEKIIVSDHSQAVGKITHGLRSHADYVFSLCPEGGRTKNQQIGLHPASTMMKGYRVPMSLRMPDKFMDLDATHQNARKPAQVLLHCGEPFELQNRHDYPLMMRENLRDAGAPVHQYEWGFITMNRNAPNIDRSKGAPETFQSIDTRKAA